jgi:aspartyl-tRNA(Asn)/glutamyl-tRNA(Gln) amidotransferase subunit A
LFLAVIPGRPDRAEPGIHNRESYRIVSGKSFCKYSGYGFRARAFGAPRNDTFNDAPQCYLADRSPADINPLEFCMKPFSSRERLELALARINDPKGEGAKACLTVYTETARAAADAADARAKAGVSLGPLDGVIVSIKDLFDVAGEPTRAGSKVLADEAQPAAIDAPVVRRLRAGGAVIVAKTNMTEFALGAIGANPHLGTPANPRDRARVPGGSSSGAAVTVGDRMAEIAIGSDTGGSVRIPAALCGIVGFKPSRQRVPTAGAFPLSTTLDSIGPLANSVADCAKAVVVMADAVMAGEDFAPLEPLLLAGLRFGIAQGFPLENLEETVAAAFDAATERLAKAGVRLTREPMPLFDEMRQVNAYGGVVQPEAYAIHQDRMKRRAADIDPNIRGRLERGGAVSAADYINSPEDCRRGRL